MRASKATTAKFCRCVKAVRNTVRVRKGSKEGAAIAICTKSVLQTKGKTLRKISCRKKRLNVKRL